ncbi:MAG: response regulator [Magnetococcales bacterium]|nr:response regulator [Magnetococcales bacterium]
MHTATVRVLTVDDSRTVRRHVRQTLEQDDEYLFSINEAENGAEAVRFLSAREPEDWPDVIVLDRNMPVLSGDECIRVLKTDEEWRVIPVLFLTAQDNVQEVVRGLSDLQADAYLPKPFHTDELLARVKVLVRIKRAEDNGRQLNKHLAHALEEQKRAYEDLKTTRIQLAETQAMAVMTKVFEKFVPKQFLQRIAKEGVETIQAGRVESETITILFSDIRSFTQISETMSPDALFAFLNDYLSRMERPIQKHHGFIDKFIGDAVMALFDGNFRLQAQGAAQAAVGMQRELQQLNAERREQGLPAIGTGIGIHIGSVMLGTLGNDNRMDSTVIGDAVNLASRLEGLTKFYGSPIVVSEDVVRFLDPKEFVVRELDRVAVKGRGQAVSVYELFATDDDPQQERRKELAKRFKRALELYRNREWQKSSAAFKRCLEWEEGDLASKLYLERCALFQKHPPEQGWDGVFAMDHK